MKVAVIVSVRWWWCSTTRIKYQRPSGSFRCINWTYKLSCTHGFSMIPCSYITGTMKRLASERDYRRAKNAYADRLPRAIINASTFEILNSIDGVLTRHPCPRACPVFRWCVEEEACCSKGLDCSPLESGIQRSLVHLGSFLRSCSPPSGKGCTCFLGTLVGRLSFRSLGAGSLVRMLK